MQRFGLARPFLREAAQLSVASAAAQLIALAVSPMVLHRYESGAFGVSSLLIAVAGSAGQLACLKYDLALLALPKNGGERPLIAAAAVPVGMAALFLLLGFPLFGIAAIVGLLMSLILAAVGCYTIGSALCLRGPGPAPLGRATVVRALLQAISQLAFSGWQDQVAALLFSYLLSYLGGIAALLPGFLAPKQGEWRRGIQVAAQFREYPLLLLPGALAFHLSVWLHQLAVLRYDPVSLGCYAVVDRLLAAPLTVFSSAVGQLFLRWLCGLPEEKRRGLYDKVSFSMLALSASACFVLYPAAPLIPKIFGAGWRGAVGILRALLPYFAVRFAVAPVTSGLIASDQRRTLAFWQCSMLLLTAGAVVLARGWGLSLLSYLALYGFFMTAGYLVIWSWGRSAVTRKGEAG